MAGDRDSPPKMSPTMPECHSLPSSNSLIELLDGVILLYLVAHKQLGKVPCSYLLNTYKPAFNYHTIMICTPACTLANNLQLHICIFVSVCNYKVS